jgi:acyl-CoA-binding protein
METDEDLGIIPGEDAFSAAADRVAVAVIGGGPDKPSESDLLRLYGLYKQATAGDCTAGRPWFWQFGRRQQW